MIDLTIDVEEKKDRLGRFVGDKLSAFGSAFCVDNADLEKVLFEGHDVPDKDKLLQSLRASLAGARGHSLRWQNELAPELACVSQGVINFGTLFATVVPEIRKALRDPDEDGGRKILSQIFPAMADRVDEQTTALTPVKKSLEDLNAKLKHDADNFSDTNSKFKELEKIDEEDLKNAKAAIDQLEKAIQELNDEISKNEVEAGRDFTIASVAMSFLGKTGAGGKTLGLAVGMFFIVSAGLKIDELDTLIDEKFRKELQELKYEMEVYELNEQLLCLHTVSNSLQRMQEELADLIDTLDDLLGGWAEIKQTMNDAVEALKDTGTPLNQIISEFNLGRVSAEWEDAVRFAGKMERELLSLQRMHKELIPASTN